MVVVHETEISFGGIDVGKYKSVAAVVGKNGNIIRESKLPTSLEHLCAFFAETEPKPSLIALESGTFGRALCIGLREGGFNAIVIDARHAAPILRGMKQQKTDRNDAIAIANLARITAHAFRTDKNASGFDCASCHLAAGLFWALSRLEGADPNWPKRL